MVRIEAQEIPGREVALGAIDLALQRHAAPLPQTDVDAPGDLLGEVGGYLGVGIEAAERPVELDVAGFGFGAADAPRNDGARRKKGRVLAVVRLRRVLEPRRARHAVDPQAQA